MGCRRVYLTLILHPISVNSAVSFTVIHYAVTDPKSVRYEVANFRFAISKLAQTNLRNLIGDMSLYETLTARDTINIALRTTLDEATDKWGVKVVRVEVQKIDPPGDIADAMSKQMKAEREKRATILSAEAYREKQILEAEGNYSGMLIGCPIAILYFLARKITAEGAEER